MSSNAAIHPGSVVLASGGARGVTAECVIQLAQTFRCKFILIGRSPLSSEPAWAQGCADEAELKRLILADLQARGEKPTPLAVQKAFNAILSRREIQSTLDRITTAGGQAVYISGDIARPESYKDQLTAATQQFGPVTGILHGAGSLADKRIEKKSAIDFEMVYSPKINGLKSLLANIPARQLDFLVLFSSVVSIYGNAGQTDYAIANAILDQSARILQRENPNCRVISINWGPWEGGMVTPALKKLFEERNIQLISLDAGAQTLIQLLAAPQVQGNQVIVGQAPLRPVVSVAGELRQHRIRRRLQLAANPFVLDHKIGENGVLPATCAAAWIAHSTEQLYPGYRFLRLADYRILKGLVFDDKLAPEHWLELAELTKNETEITLEAKISSEPNPGKRFYHYKAQVTLRAEEHWPAPEILPLPDTTQVFLDGEQMYQDGTLFHGPAFQGIHEVYRLDEQGMVMRCYLPKVDEREQGQFPAITSNPYLNDAVVQCLLVWSQRFEDAPCLPSYLVAYEQYRPMLFDRSYIVSLQIQSNAATAVVGDILVQDEAGLAYARIQGLEGTVSPLLKRLIGARAS